MADFFVVASACQHQQTDISIQISARVISAVHRISGSSIFDQSQHQRNTRPKIEQAVGSLLKAAACPFSSALCGQDG
jgi:hypothetical protein